MAHSGSQTQTPTREREQNVITLSSEQFKLESQDITSPSVPVVTRGVGRCHGYLQGGGQMEDLVLEDRIGRDSLEHVAVQGVGGQRFAYHDVMATQQTQPRPGNPHHHDRSLSSV